ncbi:hypothetical protein SNK04_014416 [Fusarium graminearum]
MASLSRPAGTTVSKHVSGTSTAVWSGIGWKRAMVAWRDAVNQALEALVRDPPAHVETWEQVRVLLPQPESFAWPAAAELPLDAVDPVTSRRSSDGLACLPTNGQRWSEYGRTWVFDGSGWGPVVAALSLASSLLPERTLAQLLDPVADKDRQFRVTDAPGGEAVVYCDGTNYLRVSDQSPVK